MDMMWGMPGMMLFGTVFWVAILIGVGLGIWWLASRPRPTGRDAALEMLPERYARGEISREEFETRRRDLAA